MEGPIVKIPAGHHPGVVIAAICKKKKVTAPQFSQRMNISYYIVKRFFAGEISVHHSTVNIVADAVRYFTGLDVYEEDLLRAQEEFNCFAARNKALSRAALKEALEGLDLTEETRHLRALASRKEQEVLHAAAMNGKAAEPRPDASAGRA